MSPRNRNTAGFAVTILSDTLLAFVSSAGPSPTAATIGSDAPVHAPGRKLCQSFGVCWMSVRFPFESVTSTVTGVVPGESAWTASTPGASRYFCVGHTNEYDVPPKDAEGWAFVTSLTAVPAVGCHVRDDDAVVGAVGHGDRLRSRED